jgi:hypothetical protein
VADILRGYTFSREAVRYRDTNTGRFVALLRVNELMEQNVAGAENRLAQIVQGLAAKEIDAGYAQTLMRDELRRTTLQNSALGKGGFDRLTARDYGRAGQRLRDSYGRLTNLVSGMQSGDVSLAQALRRVEGYALEARQQFFAAQRDAHQASTGTFEERRILHAQESCGDCIGYAAQGWVAQGTLPLPGEESECGNYCRCTTEIRNA